MRKAFCALLALLLLVMSCSITSFAEETRSWDDIEEISITLVYDTFKAKEKYSKNDIEIIVNGGGPYEATPKSLNKSSYREGDEPVFTVTLTAEDDHRFSSEAYYKRNVNVENGEAFDGTRSSGGKTVTLKIYLNEVLEADDPGWDHDDPGYSGTSSGGPGVNPETQGAWLKDPNNGRWWYSLPNGTRPAAQWMLINDRWYYFDQAGFAIQNTWIKWNEKWYYCGPECDMYVNRRTPDGYYVDRDGVWDGKPRS